MLAVSRIKNTKIMASKIDKGIAIMIITHVRDKDATFWDAAYAPNAAYTYLSIFSYVGMQTTPLTTINKLNTWYGIIYLNCFCIICTIERLTWLNDFIGFALKHLITQHWTFFQTCCDE